MSNLSRNEGSGFIAGSVIAFMTILGVFAVTALL
jgi:hypothetical protein